MDIQDEKFTVATVEGTYTLNVTTEDKWALFEELRTAVPDIEIKDMRWMAWVDEGGVLALGVQTKVAGREDVVRTPSVLLSPNYWTRYSLSSSEQ